MAKRRDWDKANKKKLMQTRGSEFAYEPQPPTSPVKTSPSKGTATKRVPNEPAGPPAIVQVGKCGVCGVRLPLQDLPCHLAKHQAVRGGS